LSSSSSSSSSSKSSSSSSSSCKIKERGEEKAGDPDLSDLHRTSTSTSSFFSNLQVRYLLILSSLFIYLHSVFTLRLFIRFPFASSALVYATLE
jgi:hypothetical protein